MTFYIKQNDTQPRMLATLKDGDENVIDLTDATVRFHMRAVGGAVVTDAAAVVVTAASGLVRYDWSASDTEDTGSYQAEFEVTYADGTIETFPNNGYIRVQIGDDIA
jgi:hypothetical protein